MTTTQQATITAAEVERYAGGECANLAYAVLAITSPFAGWSYRLVCDAEGTGFGHWVVRVSEDQYLDIRGLRTGVELLAEFSGTVLHVTDPESWGWLGATTTDRRTYEVAVRLLASEGLLTEDHREYLAWAADDLDDDPAEDADAWLARVLA